VSADNLPVLPMLTFAAVLMVAMGIFSVVSDLFLRERQRVSRRVDDRFRLQQRERAEQAMLFKGIGQLAAEAADSGPGKLGLRGRLRELIDQSGMEISESQFAFASLALASLAAAAGAFFHGPIAAGAAGAVGAVLPLVVLRAKRKARLEAIRKQLPEAFDLMARVIRAGQTMAQAMLAVADEFPPPLAAEFSYCYEQQNLGLPLEEAYAELGRRADVVEVKLFIMASLVQQQTGGNLSELLEKLAAMVRERYRLRGAVETLTAEGRMQAWILTGLPPALLMVMLAINASYARLLFDYPKLLLATVGLEVLGFVCIRKIINFDF
jgi:tight adherence protein B